MIEWILINTFTTLTRWTWLVTGNFRLFYKMNMWFWKMCFLTEVGLLLYGIVTSKGSLRMWMQSRFIASYMEQRNLELLHQYSKTIWWLEHLKTGQSGKLHTACSRKTLSKTMQCLKDFVLSMQHLKLGTVCLYLHTITWRAKPWLRGKVKLDVECPLYYK